MDFGSVITAITELAKENLRIIVMVSLGLIALGVLAKISSIIKEERAQEKAYQDQSDQFAKSIKQIFSELQEIRYAIYELRKKDESSIQESKDL